MPFFMRKDIEWPESYFILGTPFGAGGAGDSLFEKAHQIGFSGVEMYLRGPHQDRFHHLDTITRKVLWLYETLNVKTLTIRFFQLDREITVVVNFH